MAPRVGARTARTHRGEVDHIEAARRSSEKALAGAEPQHAEPGTYEVVLEASAVAMMIDYLSYSGCGAKQVIEGDSFLATKAGEVVAEPRVTVTDEASHPCSVGIGFDFEGVPRTTVRIIDDGVAKEPVTDLRTARQLGTTSTGHSSGSAEYGPYASNPVLAGRQQDARRVDLGGLVRFPRHPVPLREHPRPALDPAHRDDPGRNLQDRER